MSKLKQLVLRKRINDANDALEKLREEDEKLNTRSEELEATIDEAETDEELEAVEAEINELDEEKEKHEKDKKKLEDEVNELEEELRELINKTPKLNPDKEGENRSMDKENKQELRQAINTFIRSKGAVQERDVEGFKVVDGGALVPEEFLSPEKEVEDVVDLQKYVRTVSVNRGSGSFPIIKKSGTRMNSVEELEKNPELAKPKIDDVDYKIVTYRGYIPVSQEVIDDADYDIIGLIDEEIKDQGLNTRNYAIAQLLKSAEAKTVEGLDGIITLFNTGFKSAYQVKAYVSKSLYNTLDLLKDKNGRYLLEDDITVESGKRIRKREVVVLDDDVIGDAEGDLVGFVGDAKAFATFFDRKQTYVRWVKHEIYGELLAGFVRFDVKDVDEDAGYYITFEPAEIPNP